MTPLATPEPREMLPLSLLNDYLYCPRRAALKVIEGWREANQHTVRGDIVHEHSDLAGYEVVKGVTLWRALPVWSDRLGLSGKCDIVEVRWKGEEAERLSAEHAKHADDALSSPTFHLFSSARPSLSGGAPSPLPSPPALRTERERNPEAEGIASLFPVEFKLGKRRPWENDDVQVCAQAMCLEEMFGLAVPRGAIFHADSKRRREVEFTAALRQRTEEAARELQALIRAFEISDLRLEIPRLPPAIFKPACEQCSLYEICLPEATCLESRAERLIRELFLT